jgi:hypothetical protein
VSFVNWDKLGNDASTQIQHWVANVDVTNLHGLFHTLGIPVSGDNHGSNVGLVALNGQGQDQDQGQTANVATNQSSYKIGLKYGHDEYHQCYTN